MRIDKQLPPVPALNPQDRRQAQLPREPAPQPNPIQRPDSVQRPAPRRSERSASFNIQLNRQLSSMQLAERYLATLESRLGGLKLVLSSQVTAAGAKPAGKLQAAADEVKTLLQQRSALTGGALDPAFKLSLNEPPRLRLQLQGLESLEAIRQSGKETLVFNGGRALAEPVAVLLDDDMSEAQVLRSFNAGLGAAGLRAELSAEGRLEFSVREGDWQELQGQLGVRGEGKLFPKEQYTRVEGRAQELLTLPDDLEQRSVVELRRNLDAVVAALDKVAALREQLAARQAEIRQFLARHADQDEKVWAQQYANNTYQLMTQERPSYTALTQAVLAQANISRFTVVGLLS